MRSEMVCEKKSSGKKVRGARSRGRDLAEIGMNAERSAVESYTYTTFNAKPDLEMLSRV